MKAVVVHGAGDLRVDDVPRPALRAGEVLLAVEWVGICGSDLAYAAHGSSGTAILKHPLVLGHEVAGRVIEVGDGVDEALLGTAAAVHPPTVEPESVLPDRLAGRTNLHTRVRYLGSAALDPHTDGGFCELKVVRRDQLLALPDTVDTRRGALAEPLAVAVHAVNRVAGVLPGGVAGREVLVNGAGPIGLLVILVARQQGAARVTASDISDASLARATACGADEVINVATDALLPQEIEVVIEASGAAAALGGVLRATARGGVLVQVGNLSANPVTAVLGDLVTREVTWVGSFRFADEMEQAIQLLADGLDVDAVISHEFGLGQALDAFAVAADRASGASKVLLKLHD